MPIPAGHFKTYEFSENTIVAQQGSADATNAELLIAIKDVLIGLEDSPPVVAGSSDGVAGGMDGVDRLVNAGDFVHSGTAGAAHTWLVLSWSVMGVQVLIDFNDAQSYEATVVASRAGFTGGSATARPTATDEIVLFTGSAWGGSAGNIRHIVHAIHAVDGRATQLVVIAGGVVRGHWFVGDASPVVVPWATPSVVGMWCNSGGTFHGGRVSDYYKMGASLYGWHSTLPMSFTVSTLACSVPSGISEPIVANMTSMDLLSGDWNFTSLGLYSITSGRTGLHGRLPDLYAAPKAIVTGTRFPSDDAGGRFVKLNDLLIPWSGVVPLTT